MSYTPEFHCGGCKTDDGFCRSVCILFESRERKASTASYTCFECSALNDTSVCTQCGGCCEQLEE